jgi:feruloyl esterase
MRLTSAVRAAILLLSGTALHPAAFAQGANPSSVPKPGVCEQLKGAAFGNAKVVAAMRVRPGEILGEKKDVAVRHGLCRAVVEINPASDADIKVEVWLPDSWNGKYLGTGTGGGANIIYYSALNDGVARGYATANSDIGTKAPAGPSALSFGRKNPERGKNFAYRATHEMALAAKAVIARHYGLEPVLSLFSGCSGGGYQALALAQRFPDDYDGIAAGAPVLDFGAVGLYSGWTYAQSMKDRAAWIPPAKLPAIGAATLEACDSLDGLRDGLIADPRACRFDPKKLSCPPGADNDSCLTAPQVATLEKVYAGFILDGKRIYAGFPTGAEATRGALSRISAGAEGSLINPASPGILSWALADSFKADDWLSFDFDRDGAALARGVAQYENSEVDMSRFREKGGKLILWTGWFDALQYGTQLTDYYDRVLAEPRNGDAKSFARLFLFPGMDHCGRGPGPNHFGQNGLSHPEGPPPKPEHDLIMTLDRWAAGGDAPTKLVATKFVDDAPERGVARSRPVCAYPAQARWIGQGSIDDANNFKCVPPGD